MASSSSLAVKSKAMPKPSSSVSPVPTPPDHPPPKRARTNQDLSVAWAEEAVSEPMDGKNLSVFSLMFTVDSSLDINHELRSYTGVYHRIGNLNNKPLFKSQQLPCLDEAATPFSPLQVAYLWFSEESGHWLLSKHCFDESCGEKPFWGYLDVKVMMSNDLFSWVAYPWWSHEPFDGKWRSFAQYAIEQINFMNLDRNKYLDEFAQVSIENASLRAEVEALRDELQQEERVSTTVPTIPDPGLVPETGSAVNPSSSVTGVTGDDVIPPLPDDTPPERPAMMTLASGVVINTPPLPVNRIMVPGMAPVKKTGYMAKLVAHLVACDMQLSSRLQELKDHFFTFPRFKELYDSHRDMMERTGLDHRFNFP